jgi:hypothetical protein
VSVSVTSAPACHCWSLVPALGSAESLTDAIEEGFRQPSASAKPQVYWQWINGNVT